MKPNLNYLVFEVTTKCNLQCKYCYNIWKLPQEKTIQLNSFKSAKKTLKKIFSIAEVEHVTFTGGEPFLAERFLELVLFARLKNKSVSVISNGNTGSEKDLKTLIDFGVNLFEFPIHSYKPEIHDKMTNTVGSWEKSVATTKFVIENGGFVVPVIVITKYNFAEISETLEFINKLGLKRIMLNRYNIGGERINNFGDILPNIHELRQSYKSASKTAFELNLRLSSNVCTPFCILNPKDYPNIGFSSCSTDISKRPLSLDIQGNLRFCNHSPTLMGNIFTKKFSEILNSEESKLWENTIPEFCTNCPVYEKCMGGCRAASEQMGFTVKEVDPIIKHYQIYYQKDLKIF